MNFVKRHFRKFKGLEQQPKLYESLDTLPIWNWFYAHRKGDLSILIIEPTFHVEGELLVERWNQLNNEFIERFGLSESAKDIRRLENRIAKERIRLIETQNLFIKNRIKILENQLKALKGKYSSSEKHDNELDEEIISMEQFLKREIDPRCLSTTKFYLYRKRMQQFYERENSN